MKRRSFVKTSLLSGALGALSPRITMAAEKLKTNERDFYELRVYSLKDEKQQKLVEEYYEKAAVPALNRCGVKCTGVFTELKPAGQTKIYVLIPYSSWDDYLTVADNLSGDAVYREQASFYLNAPAAEPAYDRIESSLLSAFNHFPKLEVPEKNNRIFELRRYEHATEGAGKKKLEMFNGAGEIDIFKRLGFKPVFFGETLVGEARPNLIYMITFDSLEAKDSHWKAFGSDPEWKKISVIPDYADAKLVSKITSTLLTPCSFSQI
jgi:NIPSNAP